MKNFTYECVQSTLSDKGVRTIALNRPASLNAMNRQLIEDVSSAFNDANEDPKTLVIIFTGVGRAFCAGDDREQHVHPENEAQARSLVAAIQRVTQAITFGAKPVVGAINGWAVGGGFEWAINCDFPLWGESAKAFFPEVSLNLFVTGGVTSLLPALVGLNKAREMLMLGERYSANELLKAGVAWRVSADEELLEDARNVAEKLALLPPLSLHAMKRVLNQTASSNINAAILLESEATISGFMDPKTTKLLTDFS
ncbi:MAG: enoyl-CoA hydratase/isomerase family protein [Oceanospirillaceae bacterium]